MNELFLPLTKIVSGLAALTLIAGVASAQTAPTPKKGGTAIVAIGSEPTGINPVITSASPELMASCLVYEGLVLYNSSTDQPEPLLAESWTISPDGKTYTFKLRKTNWHDGQPLTSEDVRYTLVEVASKFGTTFAAQAAKALEAINTPDPQTVEIKLKEPFGALLRTLQCPLSGGILPAHLFKGKDVRTNPVTQRPVGTGPFKFSEWVVGDHITVVRNENYWDAGKPYLDSVIIRFMPSAASRTQALLAGEVDYIPFTYFPPADGKTVDASARAKRVQAGFPANQLWLFFNLKRKPFDDVRVRHALLVATDRDYIFNNAFFGLGRPGTAPWATQIPWASDPNVSYNKSHPFSSEKAAQMLDEAGYKPDANGIRLKLSVSYDPAAAERQQTALALQGMWRRAGVELNLQPLEAAVLLPRVHQEMNFDTYFHSYQSYGDPAIGIGRAYLTSSIGATFGNAASYSNQEVDALFARAQALTETEARGAVYRQIVPILMRDLPAFTLHENRGFDAASKKLMGAWTHVGNARLGNAWLEP